MKQLSELLDEVKAGAPPARYDIDDVVAAGKRRQRLRNSGRAAVAAVAVAAAIGVPRIASLEARPHPGPQPAATATVPTVTPEFTFTGFKAGKIRVEDPSTWSLAVETASIRRAGSAEIVGTLKVYHPGVDPVPGGYRQRQALSDVKPAGGRRAFELPLSTAYGEARAILIGWEYADGAVATVEGFQGSLTHAELKQVAESFATGKRRPVTLAFRPARLPAGYRVVSIVFNPGGVVRSAVHLVPADRVAALLARPGRDASPGEQEEFVAFSLTAGPEIDVPTELKCVDRKPTRESKTLSEPNRVSCWSPVRGGAAELAVGSRYLGADEIRREIAATEVGDPGKPATWWPVADAIPASAMPPAK